jgi:large subunit ribosomal protein L6
MSRIGKQPVSIPEGIKAEIKDGRLLVSGPKGELDFRPRPEIELKIEDNQIIVSRGADDRFARAYHGLSRALIANMIRGVTEGFSKTLKITGTGYRVASQGEKIALSLGFSHPVIFEPPAGIKLEIEGNDTIKVSGPNKDLVGQVAAKIRDLRPPEPYKGKGIRYEDEVVRKKMGKAGKAGVAGEFAGG